MTSILVLGMVTLSSTHAAELNNDECDAIVRALIENGAKVEREYSANMFDKGAYYVTSTDGTRVEIKRKYHGNLIGRGPWVVREIR